jgi:glycopeptide antibiotics resistance protein
VGRLWKLAALAASLAFVLSVTLRPTGARNRVVLSPFAPHQLESVNVLGNVVLFALPAAVLSSLGWPLRRTVAAGFALSLAIELLQLGIPGRTTATVDVLCNTLGAALGWLVVSRLSLRRRRSR